VGAERVPLAGRQRAFEQGAEDRRFDLRPVGVRGLQQQADLLAIQGDDFRLLEELAVEARQRGAQDDGEAAASISRHSAASSGTNCCGLFCRVSSKVVKAPWPFSRGSRPTSSANIENRQRVRKPATSSG
jgi:hypothetical protein